MVPIIKKNDRTNLANYRPISIFSCFAKILEKLIYTRLINFLTKHEVTDNTQYDFQRNTSTNHALIDVITTSMDNINNQLFTGLIVVDLTKAFETVCHKILLSKLDHFEITCMANDLIFSFLTRKQYVSALETSSCMLDNHFGVPQKSAFGPLLFLLYINDSSSALNCTPRLFADNTC